MGFSGRYMAAHLLMPRLVAAAGPQRVLDAIERKDDSFFIPVWMEAGFRFAPSFVHAQHAGFRFGVVTMPKPQDITEAYLGLVVGKPAAVGYSRYFTLEHSVSVITPGAATTVIGEWSGGAHRNFGAGPLPSGDLAKDAWAFTQAVMPHLLD